MYKKLFSFLLMLALTLSAVTPTFATSPTENNASINRVLSLSESRKLPHKEVDFESIDKFNEDNITDFADYEMLFIHRDDMVNIKANKLVELIDNGVTLYVEDNNLSLKEISSILGIDEPDDRFISGAQVTGTAIFNINNNYCFCVICVVECKEINLDRPEDNEASNITSHDPILVTGDRDKFDAHPISSICDTELNIEDFLNAVNGFRCEFSEQASKEIDANTVYMQLPTKGFDDKPYYNYASLVGDGEQRGSLTISQYRYGICTYKDGSTTKVITDIVSTFTISPCSNLYVKEYSTRMHANISNMNVIGQSYLNTNSTSSYTLSGGFSAQSDGIVTGSIGGSTTNTYSTNCQTIQNDFLAQKYKNWNSVPDKHWKGSSWELEPCIRILNTNATNYKNQAYSSFQSGVFLGEGLFGSDGWEMIKPFEVGGAW